MASIIANCLLKDGMIWGENLEWYIKTSLNGIIEFRTESHYLSFENKVLEYVENRVENAIKIIDINTNKSKIYLNVSDLAKDINKSDTCINNALKKGTLISKKFIVRRERATVKEISYYETC